MIPLSILRVCAGKLVCAAALLVGLVGCATIERSGDPGALPQRVLAELERAELPSSSLSVIVRAVATSREVVRIAPERASAPASVMKVITALAALDTFGPAHRFRTHIATHSNVSNGVVEGDIHLVGGGSVDFGPDGLHALIAQLRLRGIEEIRGDLVLDRSRFQPERPDIDAPPFDESPEFGYNVIPDALLFGQNLMSFQIASSDSVVQVRHWPPLPSLRVEARLSLIDAPCADWEKGWKIPQLQRAANGSTLTFRETFPKNCAQTLRLNVLDRDAYLGEAFAQAWAHAGGRWRGQVRSVASAAAAPTRVLAEHLSRPLNELLNAVNKASDNALTRVLYLQLGVAGRAPHETTAQSSERFVRAWLRGKGIDDRGFVFDNGSGLSRTERIPAAALVTLLQQALQSQWSAEFVASLPIAGLEGTLRNRLKDSPAAGRARLKTGTLRDVVSLAGYQPDATGERYIVVAFINHPRASHANARPVVDALVDWIARTDLSAR
jgi:serine-type D-Ala-D-Ala carboxypeptidase/endopeptidase (penicillin-binding protein 4)